MCDIRKFSVGTISGSSRALLTGTLRHRVTGASMSLVLPDGEHKTDADNGGDATAVAITAEDEDDARAATLLVPVAICVIWLHVFVPLAIR